MKQSDASLVTFLQECIDLGIDELPFCDFFTLTLTTGDVLTYTDFDADVVIGGTRFLGCGLVIPQRGNIKSAVGTDVDEMQLNFLLGTDDDGNFFSVLRGMTMQMLAAAGWLDQATILVQRLFWEETGVLPPWGPVWKFSGFVSKPSEIARQLVTLDCVSWLERLQRQVPNTIMGPGCPYQVFDARCGLNPATQGVACVAGAGSTPMLLQAPQLTQADQWFDNGYVVFTSGANKGLAASIRTYALANGIQLDVPLIAALATGDTFTAYPGCDYTQATCQAKFANQAKFGGWPYVPTPETAI